MGFAIGDRARDADKCDSIITTLLRRGHGKSIGLARRAAAIARRDARLAADPDQMGTPFLRASNIIDVPDPLRYESAR